jgi:hypothetical protein
VSRDERQCDHSSAVCTRAAHTPPELSRIRNGLSSKPRRARSGPSGCGARG